MAKSKTPLRPLRPLREALRVRLGGAGWERGIRRGAGVGVWRGGGQS